MNAFWKRFDYVPFLLLFSGVTAVGLVDRWSLWVFPVWVALTALVVGLAEWRRHRWGWPRKDRFTRGEQVLYYALIFGVIWGMPWIVHGYWSLSWRAQTLIGVANGIVAGSIMVIIRRVRYGRPVPPNDIRLHLRGDRTVPAEARYIGIQDGMHLWEVVTAVRFDEVERITVAELPKRTDIRLPVE